MDVRSDVYSLGVILYELLTDQLPFVLSRSALPESIRVICEEQPALPSTIRAELRGDPDSILLKAMEKSPARRYQSPVALSDDIGRFLTNQPVFARRAGTLYRVKKLLVRHRFAFAIAAAVASVVVAASYWIRLAESEFQGLQTFNALLQEQREAFLELDLAQAKHALGDYNKAEQHYKSAIGALERTDREDRAAEARLGLATLLLKRGNPLDYEDAEWLLRVALRYFDQDPVRSIDMRRRALEGLRTLYGPGVWNDPDLFRDLDREIQSIDEAQHFAPKEGMELQPVG